MARYVDNSATFLAGIDRKIEEESKQVSALRNAMAGDRSRATERITEEVAALARKVDQQYVKLIETASMEVVNNPCFVNPEGKKTALDVLESYPSGDRMIQEAKTRRMLSEILVGRNMMVVNGKKITIPQYLPWQSSRENDCSNFFISFGDKERGAAVEFASNLVLRILMAFPPGSVRLTMIDPNRSGDTDFISKSLKNTPEIYGGKVYSSHDEVRDQVALLTAEMNEADNIRPTGVPMAEFYRSKGKITRPYNLVFVRSLFGHHDINNLYGQLLPMIEDGSKRGIYFVILQPTEDALRYSGDQMSKLKKNAVAVECLPKEKDSPAKYSADLSARGGRQVKFCGVDLNHPNNPGLRNIIDPRPNMQTPTMEQYLSALPGILAQLREENTVRIDLGKFNEDRAFEDATQGVSVQIGVDDNGKVVNYVLNEQDRLHTMILGGSGSGKSTLMHAIITSAMVKYSPETLQFYLLDLKGMVEFDIYGRTRIQHTRLVSGGGDGIYMMRKILTHIDKEFKSRKDKGITSLAEYNRGAPETERVPRIVVVVDECQNLFRMFERDREMMNIVEKITREGRSSGIHLMLATQSLGGIDIPSGLNITDSILLRTGKDADARAMLGGEHKITMTQLESLETGQAYYKNNNSIFRFKGHYLTRKKIEELLGVTRKKAAEQSGKSATLAPLVHKGNVAPRLEDFEGKTLRTNPPIVLGEKIGMAADDYATVKINVLDSARNLLIAGNKGDERGENGLRVIVDALLTMKAHYRRNGKPYRILIVDNPNPYETAETDIYAQMLNLFADDSHCEWLQGSKMIKDAMHDLVSQIESGRGSDTDTYLFIPALQRFRALRDNETVEWATSGAVSATGVFDLSRDEFASDRTMGMQKVMRKIIEKGPENGIHTVVQVDKISTLSDYVFEGSDRELKKKFFNAVLMRMDEGESRKIVDPSVVDTTDLATDPENLRAFLYTDTDPDTPLFAPFAVSKEYVLNSIE